MKIYRLITAKTYEQHMFHRASLKLGLEVAVMDQMRARKGQEAGGPSDKLSPEEVCVNVLGEGEGPGG